YQPVHTPSMYSLSLHAALPICLHPCAAICLIERLTRLLQSGPCVWCFWPCSRDQVACPDDLRAVARLEPLGEFTLAGAHRTGKRSEEHTSELQSRENLVCRLLL